MTHYCCRSFHDDETHIDRARFEIDEDGNCLLSCSNEATVFYSPESDGEFGVWLCSECAQDVLRSEVN